MTEFLFKELTRQIIGAYFNVYNGTGRTYPEFVYESAMRCELKRRRIICQRQEEYEIFYKKHFVGLQRLDLFIAKEVVVEIKAVPHLTSLHQAQIFSYLKAFGKQIGLLLNFSGPEPEFERLIFQPRLPENFPVLIEQATAEVTPGLVSPQLIYDVIGGLYEVHNSLGPGFIHRIYANAVYYELQQRGLPVRPQKEMQVLYRGEVVAAIKFAHLRIGSVALVFPVAVKDINSISFNNLKSWLQIEQVSLGVIANFYDNSLKPIILKAK